MSCGVMLITVIDSSSNKNTKKSGHLQMFCKDGTQRKARVVWQHKRRVLDCLLILWRKRKKLNNRVRQQADVSSAQLFLCYAVESYHDPGANDAPSDSYCSSRGERNIRCLDWIFNRAHFARNRLLHIVLSELWRRQLLCRWVTEAEGVLLTIAIHLIGADRCPGLIAKHVT